MPTPSSRWPFIAAIAVLIIHGAVVLTLGVVVSPDSARFSQWADILIANHFNVAAVVDAAGSRNLPAGMYMLFVTLVGLAKVMAGAQWAMVLVAANLIFDALTAAILVRLVILATRSTAAVLVTIAFWLACFDVVTWVRMPLTDVPFLLTSFAAFGMLAAPKKRVVLAALLSVISLLLRPVGFLWLTLLGTVYLIVSGRVGRRSVIITGLLLAAVAFIGHTLLVRHPERWPFEMFARSVRWDARSYQRGEVVLQRPETSHRPPSTIVDYGAITADRFVHFFAFSAASFSRIHKLANAAYYIPLYLLAIVAAVRPRDDVTFLCAIFILTVALWHSLVVVDYDWRYRLPLLPHLIFMAACAIPSTNSRLPPCEG
jgi:hypothetical protein